VPDERCSVLPGPVVCEAPCEVACDCVRFSFCVCDDVDVCVEVICVCVRVDEAVASAFHEGECRAPDEVDCVFWDGYGEVEHGSVLWICGNIFIGVRGV
jgi:hypothetical protein